MYLEHFGLDQPPFRITPDTRVFYPGGERGAVLEALAWAVDNGEGIVKVVGEVGSGKTMLSRMLANRLPSHVDLVYLVNPGIGPDDVVPAIAFELGLDFEPGQQLAVQHQLHEDLVRRHAEGRQVVVFIEEAQNMALETLETLRLLSNLETDDSKLLQIVLFGQPELEDKLESNEIRQLRERITHSFDLRPLAGRHASEYLNFRLRAAGYRGPDLFSKAVAKELNRHAQGLIRRLNVLADKTLLAAYADDTHTVTRGHVRRAARDRVDRRHAPRRWVWGLSMALVLLLAGGSVAWVLLAGPGLPGLGTGKVLELGAGPAEPGAGASESPVAAGGQRPGSGGDADVAETAAAVPAQRFTTVLHPAMRSDRAGTGGPGAAAPDPVQRFTPVVHPAMRSGEAVAGFPAAGALAEAQRFARLVHPAMRSARTAAGSALPVSGGR